MKELRFDGRTAVVTGAGAGIGRIYARELAKRGAAVVVNDLGTGRDGTGAAASAADEVVREITEAGGRAVPNYDSVATIEGGNRIIQAGIDAFGKVDIVVNNAGIIRDKTFHKMTEEDWDLVMNVHLKGAFCVTQPTIRHMRETGYGRIIFTSSTSGLFGNFGQANYGAAKMGVVGMMNSLKLELAKYDIKLNAVAPNAWSRMTESIYPPEFEKKLKPEFIAPLALYLCSEQCRETGMVFGMGAGWFGRIAVVSAPGVCIGDACRDIEPEEIAGEMDRITSLDGLMSHDNGAGVFQRMAPLLAK